MIHIINDNSNDLFAVYNIEWKVYFYYFFPPTKKKKLKNLHNQLKLIWNY